MAGISIVVGEIAQNLFERHGVRAMVHVEEQVQLASERDDWASVKSWRYVGCEIEKLALFC
jgi:hypothetical protein